MKPGPITPATPSVAKKKAALQKKAAVTRKKQTLQQQANRNRSEQVKKQTAARQRIVTVSQIPPAIRVKLINTWIARARRIALARLETIMSARRARLYNVQYSGGFGGTIETKVPPITGAISANVRSAYEETMGLKPIGNESKLSAAQNKMVSNANDAMQNILDCKSDSACRKSAVNKFDSIVNSNATSTANSLPQLRGQLDPSQTSA